MPQKKVTVPRPRVLLAEDHAETAEQLRRLLQPHFEVVALLENGRALVSAVERLDPDVVVADISMPLLDGIDAAAMIRRRDPDVRIILITAHAEPILVDRGLAVGALGYVLKDSAGDELVAAVHAVLGGRRFVSGALGGREDDPNQE